MERCVSGYCKERNVRKSIADTNMTQVYFADGREVDVDMEKDVDTTT